MAEETNRVVAPTSNPRQVRDSGALLEVPAGWELLPPGDAALTRRVKLAGPHWLVQEARGRKKFSRGLFAARATIERIRIELLAERGTESYAKKRAAGVQRRTREQAAYVEDFLGAVLDFLNFPPRHADIAQRLAQVVTAHATPVGSGTVARTQRIPIERRAEAAVIAWMRHQTTGYDSMSIPRVKGKRREIRRMLAQRSQQLLASYRKNQSPPKDCPLLAALSEN